MSLFAKAKQVSKEKSSKKSKKKSTTWRVGKPVQEGDSDDQVSKAIGKIVEIQAEVKKHDAVLAANKAIVLRHARSQFFDQLASDGVMPDTPMKVENADGESVTFVVQDRSSQNKPKQDQLDMLDRILGEDAAARMVSEETSIRFNREIMSVPAAAEVLERHLEAAIAELVEAEMVEGFEDVIEVDTSTKFRPGQIERLPVICGKDSTKIRQVFGAMGSAAVNYVKV